MATTTPFLNWSNTNCQMCARRTCTFPQKPHLLFVVGRTAHSRSLCFWKIACFCIGQCQKLATLARTSWGSQAKLDLTIFWWFFPSKSLNHPLLRLFRKKLCALKEFFFTGYFSAQIRILFLLLNTQIFSVPTFCIFVVMLRVRVVLSLKRRANTRKRIH